MIETPKLMQTTNGVLVGASQERSLQPEDTEISIFDAQRYFNETNNNDTTRVCKRVSPLHDQMGTRFSSASSEGYGYGGRPYRVRSFHDTPTASSEASWNSQTGLLSNPPGAIPVSITMKSTTPMNDHNRKRSSGIKWLWGRRCPCPCSGKKSVQVEPKTPSALVTNHKREDILLARNRHEISSENQFHNSSSVTKSRPPMRTDVSSGTGVGFTFPILNQQPSPTTTNSSHLKMAVVNRNHNRYQDRDSRDPPRDSLEVFQPKKLSLSRISITITDDDVRSNTSSDLFEIESFSTTTQAQLQTTSNTPYRRRDSLDEASNFDLRSTSISGGCQYSEMMNECYEPSEVSIDWSVTTAEGFERASVAVSEADETDMITVVGNGGKKKSSSGGLLMSCRCEKAVSVVVGPNQVKNVSPQGQAANTSKRVVNVSKPPLARLSLPFAA